MSSYTAYEGYLEFCGRTTQKEDLHAFFRTSGTKTGLAEATSCISAGAGNGTFDSRLIKESMPMLVSYTGFDQDLESFKSLQANLQDVKTLRTTNLLCCPFGAFVCPSKVDTVFMTHILYYFDDITYTIARGLNWLKSDGRLVIVIDGLDEEITHNVREKPVACPVLVEAALEELQLQYKEYQIGHKFRATQCSVNIVDFFLGRKATDAEAMQIRHKMRAMTDPVTGLIRHSSHVYVVEKSEDNTETFPD